MIVRLLTALFVMWAASGHAQTVFPLSENDVDASGTVLMCPKSNIYAPCRDTGSLPLPVEFGGALNLFLPRHRAQEANDASGTAQANSLSTALMCPSRRSTYVPCADVGTLPLLVEVGRAPKLFAQVITPYRNGQRRTQWLRAKRTARHFISGLRRRPASVTATPPSRRANVRRSAELRLNRRSVLTFALFALAARRLPLSAWTSRAEAPEKMASLVWRHGVSPKAATPAVIKAVPVAKF
jgi:hypothetical protein